MTVIDELLAANAVYAADFPPSGLPMPPAKRVAVVVCMDARIHPERALGFELGDAHVIRNAGGRLPDALRSLVISQTLLGTEAVAIVHHTDCGMLTFTDDEIRQRLRRERRANADPIAFMPFLDLEQSVRDDLWLYRQAPLLRQDIPVRGFIYDVQTGLLREVKEG